MASWLPLFLAFFTCIYCPFFAVFVHFSSFFVVFFFFTYTIIILNNCSWKSGLTFRCEASNYWGVAYSATHRFDPAQIKWRTQEGNNHTDITALASEIRGLKFECSGRVETFPRSSPIAWKKARAFVQQSLKYFFCMKCHVQLGCLRRTHIKFEQIKH